MFNAEEDSGLAPRTGDDLWIWLYFFDYYFIRTADGSADANSFAIPAPVAIMATYKNGDPLGHFQPIFRAYADAKTATRALSRIYLWFKHRYTYFNIRIETLM
jgi:hypothetical protein